MVSPPTDERKGSRRSSTRGRISIIPTDGSGNQIPTGAKVKANERLQRALSTGRRNSNPSSEPAVDEKNVWGAVSEGVPISDIPGGALVSSADEGTMCLQIGSPLYDAFGVEWLPIKLNDGTVGFTPPVLRRFNSNNEQIMECWRNTEDTQKSIQIRCRSLTSTSLNVPISLQPSQGFMHGLQLQAELCNQVAADSELTVYRRGSVGKYSWNSDWQSLLEEPVSHTDDVAIKKWHSKLYSFHQLFEKSAMAASITIISEFTSKSLHKTIPPIGGVGGELLFIHNGTLYELLRYANYFFFFFDT